MITALPISHYRIAPHVLLIAMAMRMGGDLDAGLMRATKIDASYCLDAPNEIPGGGCFWEVVDDGGFPDQTTVAREP